MDRKYTNRRYLDALEERVLVYDGAMGTSLQALDLGAEQFGGERTNGCNDYLVISYPQAVEAVHRSFLEVGVDVIETDTFRANRITLREYGLDDRVVEINRSAAALARRLADEYSPKPIRGTSGTDQAHPRFVAGSIGPSGKLPSANDPDLSNVTFDQLVEVFREQAVGLLEGGADVLLIETSQDILEVKAAITGCQRAFEEKQVYIPIQAQVTLDTTGRMLLGTDINAALTILEGLGIDVIGLNCSTGPEHMREPIRILGEQSKLPVSCIPNAGLPLNVDGRAVYPMEPEPFAAALIEFVERNHISVVGGCCGTTPEHVSLLVQHLAGRPHPGRPRRSEARLASAMSATAMRQDPPPTLIGERCNAQGSRKFKKMLLEEDYDGILELARAQVAGGAHALDISCAVTERADERELMRNVVKTLELGVDVPLVIDTTELDVLELALKTAPGRCLINSTHLEGGRAKADRVFSLAGEHNAAVIVLTIDEGGMAKTRDKKLEVARRVYEIACDEHGLRAQDLVFDALTFTLATGDPEFANSAIETIEGIRQIKQSLPGSLASLGVSNLSFGLAPQARPVLNSVMLYHCIQAGLDMAIVNAAQVKPYAEIDAGERELAEDLIFNRRADALQRYIEHFETVAPQSAGSTEAAATTEMSAEQRLHWSIVHRHKEGIEADIDRLVRGGDASARHEAAVRTLNTVLLPAMKEVGDKFGAGELILPFVLQSAEVMKKAVGHLEQYLEKKEGLSKGVVVLATVYGDVHDIGKNLVKTILANNGYDVIDLGKQVPAETIITRAAESEATAIGLSALLVSTSRQMPLIVNELHRRKMEIPVLVGGAAINRRFGRRILFTEEGAAYAPGVFYCKDAFEGLETMDQLIVDEKRTQLVSRIRAEADREIGLGSPRAVEAGTTRVRSNIEPEPITHPLRWGQRVVAEMPLETVLEHLSINELYRLSWGAKNTHGQDWESLRQEFDARLAAMSRSALRDGWLVPRGVYGLFPCCSEAEDLVIYDPKTVDSASPDEMTRFTCPRQPFGDHLCLADYFAPAASGRIDVVGVQVVTVGDRASEQTGKLQAAGEYSEAYYTHGLAVQAAEAAADYLHDHIRRELGIGPTQGKRYSWGYPAIPDLEEHKKVFELLPAAASELGMTLSAADQLIPEQSTAAIIVHHSEAKYYSVGETRVEQLMK
jgi:5-methyltetrahydrofolate--homocysteine methyltransferase